MKAVKPTPVTAAVLISSTAVETEAAWVATTAYSAGQRVLRTTTQRIYQRIVAGTTATAPEADPTNWLDLKPSNVWAMFDGEISTQTEATGSLTVLLKPGYINSLCLFGLEGAELTVTVRDGLGGPVVYSATKSLDGTIITNWYQYYYEPTSLLTSVVLADLPPYTDAHITITVTGGSTVKCGTCLVGTFYELGDLQYGATSSIIDYSRKDTDAFGVTSFVRRAYSDRITASLMFSNAQLNKVKGVLASLRATPCAWIGTDVSGLEVLNTYGFYKDFSITVAYPTESLCSLEIEGLT